MHLHISAGPSANEYNGRLVNDACTTAQTSMFRFFDEWKVQHHCLSAVYNRRIFVHVKSQPRKADGTSSWENPGFATVIKEIVDNILTFASKDGTTLASKDIFVLSA